jgi:septal ring factor EnvC (AmiA/AmiB activator)
MLVIVEHGRYRTAYAGLQNVQVQPGDQVNTGHRIGNVYTDGRTGETKLQFMVYRAPNRFENPSGWLRR